MEGPEGDSVYEIYEEEVGSDDARAEMELDEGYDEERRVMEAERVDEDE